MGPRQRTYSLRPGALSRVDLEHDHYPYDDDLVIELGMRTLSLAEQEKFWCELMDFAIEQHHRVSVKLQHELPGQLGLTEGLG